MKLGTGRPAGDRRRQRPNRVVNTAHTGRAAGNTMMKTSRVGEFRTGMGNRANGRA
jgi:hypothetical protein